MQSPIQTPLCHQAGAIFHRQDSFGNAPRDGEERCVGAWAAIELTGVPLEAFPRPLGW